MEEQEKGEQSEQQDTISLGGNIQLNGFKNIETAKQIVAKKISLTLEEDETNVKIKIELTAGGTQTVAEDTQNNLFTALDSTFKKIIEQI